MRALLMLAGAVLATASRMPQLHPATWDSASETKPAGSAGAGAACRTAKVNQPSHSQQQREALKQVCTVPILVTWAGSIQTFSGVVSLI
jgi:hypothetical protein